MRVTAVALALLWGLAPLLSAAHADDHVHRYCAEHGTFEEAGAASAKPSSSAHDALHAIADNGEPLDHVTCPVAHLGSRNALVVELDTAVAPTASELRTSMCRSELGHGPIAHLLLAPKASPPASSAA